VPQKYFSPYGKPPFVSFLTIYKAIYCYMFLKLAKLGEHIGKALEDSYIDSLMA
jgi:hypothetical protein